MSSNTITIAYRVGKALQADGQKDAGIEKPPDAISFEEMFAKSFQLANHCSDSVRRRG